MFALYTSAFLLIHFDYSAA